MDAPTATLAFAAASVGALHTAAPDHWMPFAALARARGWSARRAARTTVLCGIGHVTVSAALGIAAVFLGRAVMQSVGARLEGMATWFLIAFGTLYMIWALHRSFTRGHVHADRDRGLTEWSLFLLFSSDPCVALIPMIVAAAAEGWATVVVVVIAYELATIATMVTLMTFAYHGARRLHAPWVDRYGHAAAGALIVVVGAAMMILGW